jgi:acyl-CoA synthetase (AMP-forming)/AMP-acid ligase II
MKRSSGESIQSRFRAQLKRRPGRALGFMNAEGEVTWRSREEYFTRAAGVAKVLGEAGLGQGDVCLLVLHSNETCASALGGVLMAGALPLLVAPPTLQGTRSSLADILVRTARRTRAKVVVLDDTMAAVPDALAKTRARVLPGADIATAGTEPISWAVPKGGALAAMQLTSGTTGFPRVCVWRQDRVLAALDGMVRAMRLNDDDVCFNWTPLYHDMGLVNNFLLCMVTGVPMVMLAPTDFVKRPALWLQGLHLTGSTTTWSPNFGYALATKQIGDEELAGVRLDRVRAFWNAAERIHLETIRQFQERFTAYGLRPKAMKTNFGCAENVGGATFSSPEGTYRYEVVDRDILQDRHVALPVQPGHDPSRAMTLVGAGEPAPGIEIAILSRTGRKLPEGHVGEIALKTPSRLLRYLNNRPATRRAIHGQYLRTGDLGYLRGRELFWVGRVRERITIRGKKIDPSDLEPTLFKVPELRPGCFAAFGVDDAERGTQRLVVVSELRDTTVANAGELKRRVRAAISLDLGIEVGDVVLVAKGTLAKTSSGKRRHRHFRNLYVEGKLTTPAAQP